MNSPPDKTCSHSSTRLEVRHDDPKSGNCDRWYVKARAACLQLLRLLRKRNRNRWSVKEVCVEAGCADAQQVSTCQSKRKTRKEAMQKAGERAKTIGRSVEVRIVSASGVCGDGHDVQRPKSLKHPDIKYHNLSARGMCLFVLFGTIPALYILALLNSSPGEGPFWDELWQAIVSGTDTSFWDRFWKLDTSSSAVSAWAEQVTTIFGVVMSIMVAASFTVASRLATDQRGPWVPRRDIMSRAAGVSRLGLAALFAVFSAVFVPVNAVRYIALTVALLLSWHMIRAGWWIAKHLISYADEARANGSNTCQGHAS